MSDVDDPDKADDAARRLTREHTYRLAFVESRGLWIYQLDLFGDPQHAQGWKWCWGNAKTAAEAHRGVATGWLAAGGEIAMRCLGVVDAPADLVYPECQDEDDGGFGEIREDGIDVTFGGGCPVQGGGTVDGVAIYYRSRGTGWAMNFVVTEDDCFGKWEYGEQQYVWPDGGWVEAETSKACIRRAVAAWRKVGRPIL